MELIDKAIIKAELERRRNECINSLMTEQLHTLSDMLDFINTLEVKEVDLEKEMGKYLDVNNIEYGFQVKLFDFAKHFFELGLKTKKGE